MMEMTRKEIMYECEDCCPEDFQERLIDFIDYYEGKFNDIKDALREIEFDKLDRIADAERIADECAQRLF